MRCLLLLSVSLVVLLAAGCGSDTPRSKSGGKTAVLDLDEIAKRLGQDVKMTESIRAKEAALNREVDARVAALQQQLAAKRKELGDKPSEEQKKQLAAMEAQARQQASQLRTKAAALVKQHRLGVIRQFREEVKAVGDRIAAKKGIDLLLTKNDTVVFSYQPLVDITDDIAAMMAAGPALSAAPTRTSGEIAQR
jgi:Skp family chaperone for outer membrane proteins